MISSHLIINGGQSSVQHSLDTDHIYLRRKQSSEIYDKPHCKQNQGSEIFTISNDGEFKHQESMQFTNSFESIESPNRKTLASGAYEKSTETQTKDPNSSFFQVNQCESKDNLDKILSDGQIVNEDRSYTLNFIRKSIGTELGKNLIKDIDNHRQRTYSKLTYLQVWVPPTRQPKSH